MYVWHAGQEKQCSNCLKFQSDCLVGGVGRMCKQQSGQANLQEFMKHLKFITQPNGKSYKGSLKEQHDLEWPEAGFGSAQATLFFYTSYVKRTLRLRWREVTITIGDACQQNSATGSEGRPCPAPPYRHFTERNSYLVITGLGTWYR